jgi:DNA-binding transcriptional ArsR family regulator
MTGAQLTFPTLTGTLKAAAEPTRLRLLMLISEAELTVTDLTAILRQSQPRLSRHLRLLAEAGLVERHREGSWAFFRLGETGGTADIARALIARLDTNDPVIARDRERLAAVRAARAAAHRIISAGTRPNGTVSADYTSPTPPSKKRSARRLPTSRSGRCSISVPAPDACSNFSPATSTAAWVSTYHSTCWRLHAPGWIVSD